MKAEINKLGNKSLSSNKQMKPKASSWKNI